MGFNYRWSGLYKIIERPSSVFSLSAEAGTAIYFFLPYATLGTEYRYKRVYVRGHFDMLFFDEGEWSINSRHYFYSADLGLIQLIGKKAALEFELNLKFVNKDILTLVSINLTAY